MPGRRAAPSHGQATVGTFSRRVEMGPSPLRDWLAPSPKTKCEHDKCKQRKTGVAGCLSRAHATGAAAAFRGSAAPGSRASSRTGSRSATSGCTATGAAASRRSAGAD